MTTRISRPMTVAGLMVAGLVAGGCGDDADTEVVGGSGNGDEVTVQLEEQNDSGVSGEATLTSQGEDKTKVELDLEGGEEGAAHPVHVHAGTCDELGDVEHPLTDVEDGTSETTIDVPLKELQDGEFAINAHESAEKIDNYVACGVIE